MMVPPTSLSVPHGTYDYSMSVEEALRYVRDGRRSNVVVQNDETIYGSLFVLAAVIMGQDSIPVMDIDEYERRNYGSPRNPCAEIPLADIETAKGFASNLAEATTVSDKNVESA